MGRVLPTLGVEPGSHGLQQAGSYEVVKPVCDDARAGLHLARNARLGRLVTIQQILLPDPADTAGAAELVGRARRVQRVRSPHFVEIYDYIEHTHDHFCAVMEPLFGRTLGARLSRRDMTIREAVELTQSIAQGLTVLHAMNKVHGSLTSSRVFLADGERGARFVKLLDYGLGSEQEVLLGLEEKAPEQRESRPATALTDVYFLGSLLFEMLEGRRPFEVPELSGMSMAGEPIAPSLQAVISQCLKANPAHRYPSVEVLCAAVVEALAPESVVAPPRPRRTGWWVAIALLVVAGVGALFHAPLLAAITVEQAARKALVAAPAPPALEVAPAPEPVEQRPLPEGDLVIAGIVQRLSQQLAPSKKKPRRR